MNKIIIISLIFIFVFIFIIKKNKKMNDIKEVIKKAIKMFKPGVVKNAEKIFRLETNHFRSGQYLGTFSPGMEKFSALYPYGWKSLKPFWNKFPEYAPFDFLPFIENRTGKTKFFLKFKTLEAAFLTLCFFLEINNNNPGRWYALDKNMQDEYNNKIANFKALTYEEIIT